MNTKHIIAALTAIATLAPTATAVAASTPYERIPDRVRVMQAPAKSSWSLPDRVRAPRPWGKG